MGRSAEHLVICAERQDSIFLLAAGELEPAEMQELRAHLATGCPICAGVLAEAEATLAQMALAIEPVEPSAQTREALMARIGAKSEISKSTSQISDLKSDVSNLRLPSRGSSRMRIFTTALISAAASVIIACGIFLYATRTERTFFHSSNLQTVALTSPTQPQARGQVLWDRDHSQWHVAFFNLTPPPPGKEYELWFLRPNNAAPMRSKTFTVDENGHQSLIVEIPPGVGPIAGAAVTLENTGGADTPTMPIQLVGNAPG
jgi:hypothetical protein